MITENMFIPFKTGDLEIFRDKKVLVLIPHQDDETFGCGGTLIKIRPLVRKMDFCLITDGSKSDEAVSVDTRDSELDKVSELLSIDNVVKLKIPDREVFYNRQTVSHYIVNNFENYDIVFTPNIFDIHPDHRYLANIVVEIVMDSKLDVSLFFYEVTMPQLFVNFLVDITDVIDRKMELVSKYCSQLNLLDYDQKILRINRLRNLGVENTEYAEGFYLAKGFNELDEYLNNINMLTSNLKQARGK